SSTSPANSAASMLPSVTILGISSSMLRFLCGAGQRVNLLTGGDGQRQLVFIWHGPGGCGRVVSAGGVIGKVEVQHQLAMLLAQVCAVRRIQQPAPGRVGFATA